MLKPSCDITVGHSLCNSKTTYYSEKRASDRGEQRDGRVLLLESFGKVNSASCGALTASRCRKQTGLARSPLQNKHRMSAKSTHRRPDNKQDELK